MNNPDIDKLQKITNNLQNQETLIGLSNNFASLNENTSFNQSMQEKVINEYLQSNPNSNFPSNFSNTKKKIRRSKNDPSGRNFQCKVCLKSYLGSSSLYLHVKSKHHEEFTQERQKLQKSKITRTAPNVISSNQIVPPSINSTTKVLSPIIYGFWEAYSLLCSDNCRRLEEFFQHPLYIKLYDTYVDDLKNCEFKQEDIKKCVIPPEYMINKMKGIFRIYNEYELNQSLNTKKENLKLNPEGSSFQCSDDIFAKYLREISKKLEPKHYEKVLEFILLFRELLNKNGRQILKKKLEIQPELVKIFGQIKDTTNDFCQEHGAEIAPEICNEFVMKYLVEKKSKLLRKEAIDLTKTFCEWLFRNGYTKIKIMQESA